MNEQVTLREWFDARPRGAIMEMSRATGYLASSLTRIANGVVKPKLFTTKVIQTYTKGAVHFDMDMVLCPRYRVTRNGKYWNVSYGKKYIGSRKTQEAAQALMDECTAGVVA